jgi:hypothetical protein
MKEENNKNKSLTKKLSSDIVKIGNSLDLTKKLISQGTLLELNYSKVYIIPFKKEDGYYLYDKRTNLLSKGPYNSISRNREFMICLDLNNNYSVLKNNEFLFQFSNAALNATSLFPREFAPSFQIIDNKYIVIYCYRYTYGRKYITGSYLEIDGIFNFEGNKIEYPLTENDLEFIIDNNEKSDLKISDTLWEINETILRFKDNIILNLEDVLEIKVSNFHYGYAKVKEVGDYDPEYGEMSRDIGYIDVYGNTYWETDVGYGVKEQMNQ